MVFTALLIDADPQRVHALSGALVSLGAVQPVEVVSSRAAAVQRLTRDGPVPEVVVMALMLPERMLWMAAAM